MSNLSLFLLGGYAIFGLLSLIVIFRVADKEEIDKHRAWLIYLSSSVCDRYIVGRYVKERYRDKFLYFCTLQRYAFYIMVPLIFVIEWL